MNVIIATFFGSKCQEATELFFYELKLPLQFRIIGVRTEHLQLICGWTEVYTTSISTLLPRFCGKIVHKEFDVMHSSCLVDKTKCCHPFTLLYLLSAFCQVWLELESYTYTNPFPLFMFHWKFVAWSWPGKEEQKSKKKALSSIRSLQVLAVLRHLYYRSVQDLFLYRCDSVSEIFVMPDVVDVM